MRVLICGAGIAGPTLAYWLLRFGHKPVLVEEAPRLRTGGYVIDFWGVGYEIARRMGILPALEQQSYRMEALRLVAADGHRIAGLRLENAAPAPPPLSPMLTVSQPLLIGSGPPAASKTLSPCRDAGR